MVDRLSSHSTFDPAVVNNSFTVNMYDASGRLITPHYYHGVLSQRGNGLGSLLSSLGRVIVPTLKSAGRSLIKEGLRTGTGIISDVLSGDNIKTATKRRVKKASKHMIRKTIRKMKGGGRRKNRKQRRQIQSNNRIPGMSRVYKRKSKKKFVRHRKSTPDIFS